MPFAAGLDHVGSDPLFDAEGGQIPDQIEITWDDYAAAIELLTVGGHVCVVDGGFVLDYEPPSEVPSTS